MNMVRLTLEQLLGSKRGLRGTLLGQDLGESASRRSERKTFPFFAEKLQRKTPGLGGRQEEHKNWLGRCRGCFGLSGT
jgi:hypothetical protein